MPQIASVTITDVVCRDGLQDEPQTLPTAAKLRLIDGLLAAGVTSIEATAFVHPMVVPQLADADALVAALPRGAATYSALLPNLRGAQRALAAGIDEIHLLVSASESHNRANLNRQTGETLDALADVVSFVRAERPSVALVAAIATSFGCPFEGRTPIARLEWVVGRFADMGVAQIVLADTTGVADPRQVAEMVAALRSRFPAATFGLHLHNTRGLGLANAYAGLLAGIERFDASLGGLGGCPFAPGATGNIATEDLVHMLHAMGIATGIDLDALIAAAHELRALVGHELESFVTRSGKASDLHPQPPAVHR